MSEPTTPPPAPPAQPSSNRPTIALVLSIVGIVCCPICAPIAWYMGKQELSAISAGQAPEAGRGLAQAGMIIGIIGSVFLLLWLLWVLLFGGMAVIQGFSGM